MKVQDLEGMNDLNEIDHMSHVKEMENQKEMDNLERMNDLKEMEHLWQRTAIFLCMKTTQIFFTYHQFVSLYDFSTMAFLNPEPHSRREPPPLVYWFC